MFFFRLNFKNLDHWHHYTRVFWTLCESTFGKIKLSFPLFLSENTILSSYSVHLQLQSPVVTLRSQNCEVKPHLGRAHCGHIHISDSAYYWCTMLDIKSVAALYKNLTNVDFNMMHINSFLNSVFEQWDFKLSHQGQRWLLMDSVCEITQWMRIKAVSGHPYMWRTHWKKKTVIDWQTENQFVIKKLSGKRNGLGESHCGVT